MIITVVRFAGEWEMVGMLQMAGTADLFAQELGGKPGCLWRPSFQNRSAEEILLLSLDKVMCGQLREWTLPEEVQTRVAAFLLR